MKTFRYLVAAFALLFLPSTLSAQGPLCSSGMIQDLCSLGSHDGCICHAKELSCFIAEGFGCGFINNLPEINGHCGGTGCPIDVCKWDITISWSYSAAVSACLTGGYIGSGGWSGEACFTEGSTGTLPVQIALYCNTAYACNFYDTQTPRNALGALVIVCCPCQGDA